jgi:acetate kinase
MIAAPFPEKVNSLVLAGASAAVRGGLDALVFTAGIGEHSSPLRPALCDKLASFGVKLDAQPNCRRLAHFERG